MRTTIRMNPELARRAKAYALRHKKSFTEIVEEAVSSLLSKPEKRPARKKIVFPTAGDPRKRITHEQYQAAIEQMYLEEGEFIKRGCR